MPKSGHRIRVFDFSLCIIHYNFEEMAANESFYAFLSQIFFTYLSKWPRNWIAGKLCMYQLLYGLRNLVGKDEEQYTPCVRGYAPPTKKWQNYWSIPKSKCLKAFVNFLKEELGSWSKSKFSVTSEAQMKATFCTLNAELLNLFRNDKVFTICLRIFQEIMKNWICVYSKVLGATHDQTH